MTKFEKYLENELKPYIERIREYLFNKSEMVKGIECFNFYIDIQTQVPYYLYGVKILTKKERENMELFYWR